MPIRIRQLVADVIVQRSCGDGSTAAAPPGSAAAIPTAEALASLETAVPAPALHLPQQEQPAGSIDPRLLADKVYRLMRAEMAVARERE